MFEMLVHKHGLGSETLSPFVDSSVDNVLLLTNPDLTNCCFLNSSTFLNGHIFKKMKFYEVFLLILMHILSVLFFPGSAETNVA